MAASLVTAGPGAWGGGSGPPWNFQVQMKPTNHLQGFLQMGVSGRLKKKCWRTNDFFSQMKCENVHISL